MELLKLDDRLVEWEWQGVTFLIKPRLSSRDKWNVATASRKMTKDGVEFNTWEFYTTMIRTFVVGWKGVTEGGKDVPYSFDTLMDRLPSSADDNLVMQLGLFIGKT